MNCSPKPCTPASGERPLLSATDCASGTSAASRAPPPGRAVKLALHATSPRSPVRVPESRTCSAVASTASTRWSVHVAVCSTSGQK